MKKGMAMIVGAGVGAGLMYLYDPQLGRRRRALTRDKFVHLTHRINDAIEVTSRDLTNRAVGVWAEMRSCLTSEDVSDEVLAERVRSKLGGLISHPSAVEVNAEQGHVTLSGPVLRDEANGLLKGVASVRGVREVNDHLAVHDEPGEVSALQGQPARKLSGQQWDVMQRHWSPTTRLLIGAAGGAMATYGAGRRDAFGGAIGFPGMSMLMRYPEDYQHRRPRRARLRALGELSKLPALHVPRAPSAGPRQWPLSLGGNRPSRHDCGVGCCRHVVYPSPGASLAD
jgi:hypothetical protein